MKFSVFQISRRGGREKNEDRMGYCYTSESGLFVVADGMGGHPEGEVAAQIALQTVSAMFQRQASPRLNDVQAFLSGALLSAHHQILRYAAERSMSDTPRTTLVAAVLQAGSASWIHCGDSRLYLVRAGGLVTRTRDHSYMELHSAQPPGPQVPPGPQGINRNVLFTCLGSPTRPIYDLTGPVALAQGDRILLCSDGLWDACSDTEIARQLVQGRVAQAAPRLVQQALESAGESSDNVTVLALEWETPDRPGAAAAADIFADSALDRGGFASTIQTSAGPGCPQGDDLDDAAIERSIAEINEAIRRSSVARKE